MSDKLPSNQDLEKYVHDLPLEQIRKLDDGIERREAERNLEIVYDLTKRARERSKADRS